MSAPESCAGAGAAGPPTPHAAAGALHTVSAGAPSTRAAGSTRLECAGAVLHAAATSSPPAVAEQPPSSSAPAAPGEADAPVAGLAALSMHSSGPGAREARGGGEPALGLAPPLSTSLGAGGGDAASSDAGPAKPVGNDGAALSAKAAANPFCPAANERHAAFLKLVDHKVNASLRNRFMREADFCNLAAEAGVALFGDDSLIVASLRSSQARALTCQSIEESKRSRIDKGTLLPGKLRKVEEAYDVYEAQLAYRVTERPILSAAVLHAQATTFGLDIAQLATNTALGLLPLHPWRSDQRGRVHVFVLAALRLIPQTAGLRGISLFEGDLVNLIERYVTPARHGADFCASVLAVWRSPAVADVLRSRGSLQWGAAASAATEAEFTARQRADVAKKGLRECALPSCSKQETTVLQFRVCGHCQRTRYCCPEHAKLHWRVHKREYETEVEERGEAGDGGGGVAA